MTQLQLMIATSYGDISVTLYPSLGNVMASDFLRYIGAGNWDPGFDETILIDGNVISITTWADGVGKFEYPCTLNHGQDVLDLIAAGDSISPAKILKMKYILPSEQTT